MNHQTLTLSTEYNRYLPQYPFAPLPIRNTLFPAIPSPPIGVKLLPPIPFPVPDSPILFCNSIATPRRSHGFYCPGIFLTPFFRLVYYQSNTLLCTRHILLLHKAFCIHDTTKQLLSFALSNEASRKKNSLCYWLS